MDGYFSISCPNLFQNETYDCVFQNEVYAFQQYHSGFSLSTLKHLLD